MLCLLRIMHGIRRRVLTSSIRTDRFSTGILLPRNGVCFRLRRTHVTRLCHDADSHDAYFALSPSSDHILAAASCFAAYTLDRRAPEPVVLMDTSYSANVLRRTKITSLHTSSLDLPDTHLYALSSTEDVQYYDKRYPNVPLCSWAHRRGYDRTLVLSPVPGIASDGYVLSSQKNRLLTVYGAQIQSDNDTKALAVYAPRSVASAVPPNGYFDSPTPPFLAELGIEGTLGLVEQTQQGALWMRYLHPGGGYADLVEPTVYWPDQVKQWSKDAEEMEDTGPFGDTEVTQLDYRTLYKGTLLD